MENEAFVRWALDDARTVEERYAVELLVEQGMNWWNARHKIYKHQSIDKMIERQRQRALNPAYQPQYSEQALRRAAEEFPRMTTWNYFGGYNDRPIRDLTAFKFLPNLESLAVSNSEVTDVSVLADFPHLRVLSFSSTHCDDFRPLARCSGLRELHLALSRHWPDVRGLEQLAGLEKLSLSGNLLAFEPGVTWPNVRIGILQCLPLAARDLRALPQLPACEFLTLGGADRLDGIEAFPRLRNLTLTTDTRDFEPLTALRELTWFQCSGFEPLDVSPLARLPRLHVAIFNAGYKYKLPPAKPRDFSPLTDAPQLHELIVAGCPPVETEVAAINAGLPSWGDLFLRPEPLPVPPLRLIVAPWQEHPARNEPQRAPDEPELNDTGLRQSEARWVGRLAAREISRALGCTDWGEASANGEIRQIEVTLESFALVEKLPEIIDAMRRVVARLRPDYQGRIMIALIAPRPEPTPAQKELERQFREEQEEAEFERSQRDREAYIENLHRYELKKQEGQTIKPEEFEPGLSEPLPPAPWERDEDEEEDDDDPDAGDVAVKKKPDPPPSWFDDEHPLADQYRLLGAVTLGEAWFMPHHRDVALYLMRRDPDLEIPEEPPKA